MAASDKTVKVTVVANTIPYTKGMADASTATKKLGNDIETVGAKTKGLDTGLGKASGAMKGLALGAGALAGTALVGFLGDSVKAAGDLQQSIGGVDAVFKDSADSIHDFGKQAAEAVGLSRNEFNQLVTVTGAMLKNKGLEDFSQKSLDLVKIGADLAAQFGGSTKDAVEAVNAAMRGESDPIERYGISLNETAVNAELLSKGLNTLTGKALDQAKAQARIDIITRQSADAMGTFAREADTLQGQQQRLNAQWEDAKAELGQALLPALTSVTQALRGGVDAALAAAKAWEDIPGPIKAAVAAFVAFKLAQGPLSTGLGKVRDNLQRVREEMALQRSLAAGAAASYDGLGDRAATASGKIGRASAALSVSKKAISGLGNSLLDAFGGPGGIAIGAATFALTHWWQEAQKADAIADQLRSTLDDVNGAFTARSRQAGVESLVGDLSADDVDLVKQLGVNFGDAADLALKGGENFDKYRAHLVDVMGDQYRANGLFSDEGKALEGFIQSLNRLNEGAKKTKVAQGEIANAAKDTGDAALKAAPNVDTYAAKVGLANEKAKAGAQSHKDLAKAMLEVAAAAGDADKAEIAYQQALDDATASVKEHGRTLDITTEKGRANKTALLDLADAALASADANLKNGESADKVKGQMDKARESFIKVAEKMGLSKTAAGKLATELGLTKGSVDNLKTSIDKIPKQVKTSIVVADAAAKTAIRGIKAMLDAVDRDRNVTVTVKRLGVDRGDFVGGMGGTHAAGGYIAGPGTATSDSIPAWLSNGEYVIKAAAVAKYGAHFFDQLNTMRFADGGFVSRVAPTVSGSPVDMDRLAALIGDRYVINASGLTQEQVAAGVGRGVRDNMLRRDRG